MKTRILTTIAILLVFASVTGCASPKSVPDAPQLQASSNVQELQEATENPQTAVSTADEMPEKTAEKEKLPSTPSTEPASESAPTAVAETPSEPASTQPAKETSRPSETLKPTGQEPTTPPQPMETPSPTEPSQTQPAPTEPIPTESVATEPLPTQPTESAPTEPPRCQHEWICVRHEEEGHWIAGIVCDCGWTVYGDPGELMGLWNAHSASFPPEESLFEHGGCGCVDEWIVDVPAWEEWYCRYCGEPKP